MRRIRYYIFLKDVLILTLTAFGGAQAHFSMLLNIMVKRHRYITEEELIELYALCQILPGPTTTQTITAIGYKVGGPNLAYLTLLVWILPTSTVMVTAAIVIANIQEQSISMAFTKFIQPMAVGFIAYAAFRICEKVIYTKLSVLILIFSAVISYFFNSPYIFPVLLIAGGALSAIKFKKQPIEHKNKFKIQWANFVLWGLVFLVAAALGGLTRELPVRLFENFYRNGSMIFGGGQVLIPLFYTEFVEFKGYLSSEEFLSGFALAQALPGPTFVFSAYIGSLAMREYGVWGEILGGFIASAGIFLPGTFLIFFIIRFWEDLKKYRVVKASLEGINAASAGMVVAAGLILFGPIETTYINMTIVAATFGLLAFTKVPAPFIIVLGLAAGFIL